MEQAAGRYRGGYRVWFAPGSAKQTGMALIVSNRLAGAKVEVEHRDPGGHLLIVRVDALNRLSLRVVLSHAPSGNSDAARAAYFQGVSAQLSTLPDDPRRAPRWANRSSLLLSQTAFFEKAVLTTEMVASDGQ